MSDDFEIEPGVSFGQWLYDEIARECFIERHGWAPERVERVAARLQADRPPREHLDVIVPWITLVSAFTTPGRYIYFSRRLLERCPDDDTAAFVIAHEIAHHDLGHLKLFPHWLAGLARAQGGWLAAAAVQAIERRLYGPEHECDADRRALELCVKAGYDGARCIHLFDILEQFALDAGDRDIVFGPDAESDRELAEDASWATKARIWAWQRTRGYLPIQDRRAMLLDHLRELRGDATSETGDNGAAI